MGTWQLTHIWWDPWLLQIPIALLPLEVDVLVINNSHVLATLAGTGILFRIFCLHFFFWGLFLSYASTNSISENIVIWVHSSEGNYTVKSGYKLFAADWGSSSIIYRLKFLRKYSSCSPRVTTFAWKLFLNKLPNKASLLYRRIQISPTCAYAHWEILRIYHIFSLGVPTP